MQTLELALFVQLFGTGGTGFGVPLLPMAKVVHQTPSLLYQMKPLLRFFELFPDGN
ncbi:MAG: hypothetical protein FWE96_08270 [Coriobacteriia bacterium]|nr:hypothetical protein [Coriobacteriia bacterium]